MQYNAAMTGNIPASFIDDLIARTDIVGVIERWVPLTRKGREYVACCPFHKEKTPSFTVSPDKQFYHCFGCGAHGTAIGFLMDYANLGFVEAVEDLANAAGMELPGKSPAGSAPAGQDADQRLKILAQANDWFQKQLRTHAAARQATDYLKSRGLDGKVAADFGIGYAPDSWSGLVDALGTSERLREQLLITGLISRKEDNAKAHYYDRFRGRVIFPIEDHRGRVTGFGGRALGDATPKYLNSPETPLFHKGAELYGLHRARRQIGIQKKSIVVEGYMDVVSLAQFGVDNAVATLGTATTRTHLQRLFRLAPEIVFCFDGDRAGRSAAWKALEVSLPEMRDGCQAGFLFLPEGEDPDSLIRAEGAEAFIERVEQKTLPLPDFLFDTLTTWVDMNREDGKASLVSQALPLIGQLPDGSFRDMINWKLTSLTGLPESRFAEMTVALAGASSRPGERSTGRISDGRISPLALAVSLLLQNPELAQSVDSPDELEQLRIPGADVLARIVELCRRQPGLTTAGLLESFRETPVHDYLGKLAMRSNLIDENVLEKQLKDTLNHLLEERHDLRRRNLLEKARQSELSAQESQELNELLKARAGNLRS